jgi:excisionase family DNA binding protein
MIKDKYLSCNEAATLLGFTADHIRRMISKGRIKAEKVGRDWMIKATALKGITRLRKRKE